MEVMDGIGPPHVERVLRPVGPHHSAVGEELLLRVEVRLPQVPVCQVHDLYYWHRRPPLSVSCPMLSHASPLSLQVVSCGLNIPCLVACVQPQPDGPVPGARRAPGAAATPA